MTSGRVSLEVAWARSVAVSLGLAGALCGCGFGRTCDTSVPHPMSIRVRDSRSGADLCDAEVVARADDGATVTLTSDAGPDCRFTGGSREGPHRIEARRPGFLPGSVTVELEKNDCDQYITERRTIDLEPDPNAPAADRD